MYLLLLFSSKLARKEVKYVQGADLLINASFRTGLFGNLTLKSFIFPFF